MANLLEKNAFHILGLDCTASQKEITKRYKEIDKYLSIGEVPTYDKDLIEFNGQRNIENTKEAYHLLSDPKKKIVHYFFWFQLDNEIDKEAYSCIKNRDYEKAIVLWKENCEKNKTDLHAKKNLALVEMGLISFDLSQKDKYLMESLQFWKEVFSQDKCWELFVKSYKLHDDLATSETIIDTFKTKSKSYLADHYAEISLQHKDFAIYEQYYEIFKVKGDKIEQSVIAPTFQKLNNVIEKLDSMNISADGIMDDNETKIVKSSIKVIQGELNTIIDLGLYDESATKVIRDKSAASIKKIGLDIHNNLLDRERSSQLIEIAHKISGTAGMSTNLKENLDIIEKNKEYDQVVEPITRLVQAGKTSEAITLINASLSNPKLSEETKQILANLKQTYESYGTPIKKAPPLQTYNGIGTKIYGDTLYFVFFFIPLLPLSRYSLSTTDDNYYRFHGKLELHKWQKNWRYIFIVVVVIVMFNYFR